MKTLAVLPHQPERLERGHRIICRFYIKESNFDSMLPSIYLDYSTWIPLDRRIQYRGKWEEVIEEVRRSPSHEELG
jgi:hypothetical protein